MLDENERNVLLDNKSLYTNVPVSEAIEIVLCKLYITDYASDIEGSTLKMLLKLAVTKVFFKSNANWYFQMVGLAMVASLAEVLANIWMKSLEGVIKDETDGIKQITKKLSEKCPKTAANLFGKIKLLIVKNVKLGFLLSVKTSVTTITKKLLI